MEKKKLPENYKVSSLYQNENSTKLFVEDDRSRKGKESNPPYRSPKSIPSRSSSRSKSGSRTPTSYNDLYGFHWPVTLSPSKSNHSTNSTDAAIKDTVVAQVVDSLSLGMLGLNKTTNKVSVIKI